MSVVVQPPVQPHVRVRLWQSVVATDGSVRWTQAALQEYSSSVKVTTEQRRNRNRDIIPLQLSGYV